MILDFEQELTTASGQAINPTAGNSVYGALPFDQKASGADPAVGEKLTGVFKVVTADYTTATSATIAIVGSDTGASGGNEEVLATATVLLASLTTALGVQEIGPLKPGANNYQYLALKVTANGGTLAAGSMSAWLQKSDDGLPANAAVKL